MKETYLKIKEKAELPVGNISYTFKDFDGVIHPFNWLSVDFREEDSKNIKQMEAIKEKYAQFFMFFNNSDEGVKFWADNPITMSQKNEE